MRHFALVLLFIVALPATSAAPEAPARLRYKCMDDHLMLEITVAPKKTGPFYFDLPSAICGPSV